MKMFQIISQDLLGLLNYHQDITGFHPYTILKISLLFHYPLIFQQMELKIDVPLVFNASKNIHDSELVKGILHTSIVEVPGTFPSGHAFLPYLRQHSLFSLFTDDEAYPAFIESLIILFHFVIQPQYIIPMVFKHQSDIFETVFVTIYPKIMDYYIELTQFKNHITRRLESWFHQQLQLKLETSTID